MRLYIMGNTIPDMGLFHRTTFFYGFLRLHNGKGTVGVFGHENHAVGFDPFNVLGSQIDQHEHLFADEIFGLVIFRNAGDDFPRVDAGVDFQLQ